MERKKYWEEKLWKELQEKDPAQISRTARVEFTENKSYSIPSLKEIFQVYPEQMRIDSENRVLADNGEFQLLLISYLLHAQNIEPAGEWVSEKDLQGGSTFFRGPHAMPSSQLEKKFGYSKELFREKAQILGGREESFGDLAFAFPLLPRIELIIVLWLGDDEFPPRVTFLMDRTVQAHLPLDVIFAMASTLSEMLLSL